MKTEKIITIAASAFAAAAVPVFVFGPGHTTRRQRLPFDGRNYAHRGLHTRNKAVPENSLSAFRLAAESGYGVELDVQITADGKVVVFHDDSLLRICGVDKKVWDLTLDELQEYRLCGTDETIPLFSDVLNTIRGRGPIICELKPSPKRRELCEKTYDIISDYQGDICIESFDPRIVAWFRFHAPDLIRGQLSMPPDEYDTDAVSAFNRFALSRCALNFITRPQFIAYEIGKKPLSVRLAETLGAMRVAWTAHDPESEKNNDCVIFEYYLPNKRFK